VNLICITAAGITTLFVQRRYYLSRRKKHLRDPVRQEAGLPIGRSRRGSVVLSDKDLAHMQRKDQKKRKAPTAR
jgi:hypothetical protein